MKEKILIAAKSAAILLMGVFIGVLLLVVAYHFPVHTTNRLVAFNLAPMGGEYPRVSELGSPYVNHFKSFFPDVLDGGTDALILSTALDTSEGSALNRAMASHSEYAGDYSYYWHGYVSIIRPLMRVFGLSELRIFNGIAQALLMFACMKLISKKKGMCYGVMFLCSCIFLMPMAVAMSLQFSAVFYITFLGILFLLLKQKEWLSGHKYIYLFVVLGMCTSYLDLLTYPLLTWGIPMVWLIVLDDTLRKKAEWLKRVIVSGFAWIFGYAGMWSMKWILASVVLKKNIFEWAVKEVFLRSGTDMEATGALWERYNAVYVNWRHYEYGIYFGIILVWLGWWLYQSVKGGWSFCAKKYAYGLIGLSGFVWYLVLANHTTIHHFFTYRIFGVTLLAVMALMLESVGRHEESADEVPCRGDVKVRRADGLHTKLRQIGGVLATLVLAVLFTMTAKEEWYETNGQVECTTIALQENEKLETSFVPTGSLMNKLGLGLESESKNGRYQITLWDEEKPLYETKYILSQGGDGYYQEIPVFWKVEKGKKYRLVIEAMENEEPMFIWVTKDGGELLTGITYLSAPDSIVRLVFLTVSWFGALMVIWYLLKSGNEFVPAD